MATLYCCKTIWSFVIFSGLWCLSSAQQPDVSSDRQALIDFMKFADPQNRILQWNVSSLNPCTDQNAWQGVNCKKPVIGRVTFLELENLDLPGTIAPNTLSRLDQLRVLRLINVSLSGPIPPDLSSCIHLKQLILLGNKLTGNIPASLGTLAILDRLSLRNNQLEGEIPRELSSLQELQTLRLDYNSLTGPIPDMLFPKMTDFGVSHNRLTGSIPKSLASTSPTSFAGNDLCGPPTNNSCPPLPSPSSPENAHSEPRSSESDKLSLPSIIIIVVFSLAIVVFICLLLMFYLRRGNPDDKNKLVTHKSKSPEKKDGGEVQSIDSASMQFPEQRGSVEGEAGRLIFAAEDNQHSFGLKELLRASAEMLVPKGTVGTTYKAVLGEGVVFAVKRLIDRNLTEKAEFEKQLALVGRLKHPNLVPLVAYYYYAQEEKLLVYDYLPNKSLYTRLHANRGTNERELLAWPDRLQIAYGVAQGLAFLHRECPTMPHGNLKSTNVVFDGNGQACIADFGLLPFASVQNGPQASDGYRAPEMFVAKKVTHKADVYSFGVMLLELLTGRVAARQGSSVDLPRWVNSTVREEWTAEVFDYELVTYRRNSEEEMVYLLRIALDCVASNPEQRPKMAQVVKLIEDIKSPELSSSDMSFSIEHLPGSVEQ
ncbi:probable leucine-rich repeat receptor-like protein kinase At1g68400 [Selaginella moellendorffii]|nr:probable leucine-rich repeat receptor-like protein kinase At1g68400 [Selaginella moellendorffii]|eukprot:XP_002989764.2 probable leucine-rich repeat receptor-like protein kinase At1g68400 [Selaginella moellendorffii]